MTLRALARLLFTAAAILLIGSGPAAAEVLKPTQKAQLERAEYVYIQSQRKDGTMSDPAEIWFLWHDGAVWVGTSPTSWRAKRIAAGRPRAKIAIGKLEGETFWAKGEFSSDPKARELLMTTFAKKYPDGWGKWEKSFRDGFQDGSRVLIKYTPIKYTPPAD